MKYKKWKFGLFCLYLRTTFCGNEATIAGAKLLHNCYCVKKPWQSSTALSVFWSRYWISVASTHDSFALGQTLKRKMKRSNLTLSGALYALVLFIRHKMFAFSVPPLKLLQMKQFWSLGTVTVHSLLLMCTLHPWLSFHYHSNLPACVVRNTFLRYSQKSKVLKEYCISLCWFIVSL